MRIRIALSTAVAVSIIATTLFTVFDSSPAASARANRASASGIKLMSYSQAEKISDLVTYYDGVVAGEQSAYLKALVAAEQSAYLKALVAAEQAASLRSSERLAAATVSPAGSPADATSTNTSDWACIRFHESRDNYTDGNGGAYQFELGTWHAVTGLPDPAEDYPPSVQDAAALRLYSERGWNPWTTRYVCGL